nr:hypothetical protein [uncultured Draconibacterium sp.]
MRKFKRMRVGGFNLMSLVVGFLSGMILGDEAKKAIPFLDKLDFIKK